MMGDELIPVSDEQAKLARAIVDAGKDAFGYLADILGDIPKDLVGLLVGDRVKVARAERLARLFAEAKKRLQARGVKDLEPPPLKLALPILAAAADENRDELQDLWASLLAAAMDPARQKAFRQQFISTLKDMDPSDALVFKVVVENGGVEWGPNGRDFIASRLALSRDEVLVSFDNLKKLGCVAFVSQPPINPILTPFGKLLAAALS